MPLLCQKNLTCRAIYGSVGSLHQTIMWVYLDTSGHRTCDQLWIEHMWKTAKKAEYTELTNAKYCKYTLCI